MPPFQRKTLVLIGAQGVGRRSLKNRLIVMNPLRYGTTVPCKYVRQTADGTTMSDTSTFRATICAETPHRPFTSSHITPAEGRGEGRPELLLCYAGGDGEGHQGEPLPGARRV